VDTNYVTGSCLIEFAAIAHKLGHQGKQFAGMRNLIQIFEWLYSQSLKLYPLKFRDRRGEEMQTVFSMAIENGDLHKLMENGMQT
jgi:hypothetical protein